MDRLSWTTAAEGYGRHLRTTGKSLGTLRTYTSDVHLFWDWCCERELCVFDAPPSLVKEWLAARIGQVSPSRAHGSLCALRMLFDWARAEGWNDVDPTLGLRVKKGKRNPTKPLPVSEFCRLTGACETERDRLMLEILGHTGIRISELAAIQPEHCDWQRGLIRILGKGDKEDYVAPPAYVMERLRIWLGLFPRVGEPMWRSEQKDEPMKAHQIRKILYKRADEAGVDHVHPHRLRALFATEHYRQYHDIERLRRSMRHESVETTQSYIKYLDEEPVYEQMRSLTF